MGGEQVNYGASVPITTADIQKAVNKLRSIQVNQQDDMLFGIMSYYSHAFISRLEGMTDVPNDRPDWIQKLEKEWGIR